jgi:hypothetical protein
MRRASLTILKPFGGKHADATIFGLGRRASVAEAAWDTNFQRPSTYRRDLNPPREYPKISERRKSTIAIKNIIFASPIAVPAIPPKPKTAAIKAMIRSVTTQLNMANPPNWLVLRLDRNSHRTVFLAGNSFED